VVVGGVVVVVVGVVTQMCVCVCVYWGDSSSAHFTPGFVGGVGAGVHTSKEGGRKGGEKERTDKRTNRQKDRRARIDGKNPHVSPPQSCRSARTHAPRPSHHPPCNGPKKPKPLRCATASTTTCTTTHRLDLNNNTHPSIDPPTHSTLIHPHSTHPRTLRIELVDLVSLPQRRRHVDLLPRLRIANPRRPLRSLCVCFRF
jgi:hypothetical protein